MNEYAKHKDLLRKIAHYVEDVDRDHGSRCDRYADDGMAQLIN
jgi:hypothetical protein